MRKPEPSSARRSAPIASARAGGDDTLRLAYWTKPSTVNNHFGRGATDNDVASLVLEPLAASENTEDYATRLDGKNCLSDLEALALSIVTDAGSTRSVKFFIRGLDTDPEVYFQNTRKHPLHFDFAQRVLGVEGTADQFAADTYAGAGRTQMAGTLVFYPSFSGSARAATPLLVVSVSVAMREPRLPGITNPVRWSSAPIKAYVWLPLLPVSFTP